MNLVIRSFRLQKAGNAFEECEDRLYPKFLNDRRAVYKLSDQSLSAFGIADGATEGMLSGEWAEILVKAFCRSKISHLDISFLIEKASRDWDFWIKNYLAERQRHNKPIKWYEEPGLKAGSFSTLLGLVFSDSQGSEVGEWHALAIGDTCFFHIRNGKLIQSFPIENSSCFGNRPPLISSNPARNKDLSESSKMLAGDWLTHDSFYLMTDALACWFLQESEAGNSPWLSYPFINNSEEITFEFWVERLRSSKKMKNDDVTLVHVELAK